MRITRPRMLTVSVRRICFVHKVLDLCNDGEGFSDKGRKSPLGRDLSIRIPESSLGRRAKHSDMIGQREGKISKKIRPLRQYLIPIPVLEPVFVRSRAMDDFLKTENIGAGLD